MKFYTTEFDTDFVEEIKKKVKEKNDKIAYNNLPVDKGKRWVGVLGELAFKKYIESFGLKEGEYFNYDTSLNTNDKNPWDFSIKDLNIDVKTVSTKYYPKKEWACNVDCTQFNKKGANAYVFARYLYPTNTAVVMGWILKDTFNEIKIERNDGDKVGKIIVEGNFYEIPINRLQPLFSLTEVKNATSNI